MNRSNRENVSTRTVQSPSPATCSAKRNRFRASPGVYYPRDDCATSGRAEASKNSERQLVPRRSVAWFTGTISMIIERNKPGDLRNARTNERERARKSTATWRHVNSKIEHTGSAPRAWTLIPMWKASCNIAMSSFAYNDRVAYRSTWISRNIATTTFVSTRVPQREKKGKKI